MASTGLGITSVSCVLYEHWQGLHTYLHSHLQLGLLASRRKTRPAHGRDDAINRLQDPFAALITRQPLDALLALAVLVRFP